MFTRTTEQYLREISEAEKLRDTHLGGVNRIIREYAGRWYCGGKEWNQQDFSDENQSDPEPFAYSFVSNMMTMLVYENPTLVVEARRVIGHKVFKDAMQSGLRAWINDVNYKQECEKTVLDFMFFQGILMHYIEDDTRWSEGAVRPNTKRIDYRTYGVDALCDSDENAEFKFHSYWADLDELLEDPAIEPEAAAKLRSNNDSENPQSGKDPFPRGTTGAALKRERVKIYSVWSRRANTIRVFCKDPELELYPERPYYGPPAGPYTVYQAYPVPGQPYPLSPLVAVQSQVIDLQVHARAMARSAAGRKSVVIVDGVHSQLADAIKDAEDREVIAINGFSTSQAQQLEFGGVTEQQYAYVNNLRTVLREHSGLTETQRGTVSGGTATESQIAAEALNNRAEYLKARVRDATAKSLHAIGWFLFHTPGIIIPVNRRDPVTGMETEGLFFGGQFPGEESGTWEDYSIKIEPFSMQRVSEQVLQRRAMDFANFIIEAGQLIPTMPYVRWQEVIRMVGESMNQDNTDSFFSWEMLGMYSQPDLMPASAAMGPGEQGPQRYSIPGQGMKQLPGDSPNSNAPLVDERRSEMSKPFGDEYGGTQGPPGSRNRP